TAHPAAQCQTARFGLLQRTQTFFAQDIDDYLLKGGAEIVGVIPSKVRDLAGVLLHFARSFGSSRTGVVCAAQDDRQQIAYRCLQAAEAKVQISGVQHAPGKVEFFRVTLLRAFFNSRAARITETEQLRDL